MNSLLCNSVAVLMLLGCGLASSFLRGQHPTQSEADTIALLGRVLQDSDGSPIEGVLVQALLFEGSAPATPCGSVLTDADGRWGLLVPRPVLGQRGLRLSFLSQTFASATISARRPPSGSEWELPPLRMVPGVLLEGRMLRSDLRDTSAIAPPSLRCSFALGLSGTGYSILMPERLELDEQDRFRVPMALAPGSWELRTSSHVVRSKSMRLRKAQRSAHHDILIHPGHLRTLTGRVIDDSGLPLRGVDLTVSGPARHDSIHGPMLVAKSAEDGRFTFTHRFATATPTAPWGLRASVAGYTHRTLEGRYEQAVRWTGSAVKLVLKRDPFVPVRALREDTGEALRSFEVLDALWRESSGQASFRSPYHKRQDEDGVARLARSGRHWTPRLVLVRSTDPSLGVSELRFLRPSDLLDELVFSLPPALQRTLTLTDAAGEPIAGAAVQITLRGAAGLGLVHTLGEVKLRPGAGTHLLLKQGRSDADGRFRFPLPTGRQAEVTVRHPAHRDATHTWTASEDNSLQHTLQLQSGGTLHGQIVPGPWLDRLLAVHALHKRRGVPSFNFEGLRLERDAVVEAMRGADISGLFGLSHPDLEHAEALPPAPEKVFVREDGSFTIAGIPPGRWTLLWDHAASSSKRDALTTPIALRSGLSFGEGTVQELTLKLDPLLPIRVRARLRINGQAKHLISGQWVGSALLPEGPTFVAPSHEAVDEHEALQGELIPGTYYLRRDWSFPLSLNGSFRFSAETTLPVRLELSAEAPAIDATYELQVYHRQRISLTRATDAEPVAGLPLFRRYADDDPGEWLWSLPPNATENAARRHSDTKGDFPLFYLTKGKHLIYAPSHSTVHAWPQRRPPFAFLTGPHDPNAKGLTLLGTIEVQRDGQVFDLKVPASLGW